jgi:hypothetical protein
MSASSITPLLQQAGFILDACGRQVSPAGPFVDIPAHVCYTRYMPGSGGTEDISGIQHKGRVSFMIRGITAQVLPRVSPGLYWRLRLPGGRFFQSELTAHSLSFGFGSDRQAMSPVVEWKPGDKLYVDLDTILAGPPPESGYSVVVMFEGVYRFPITGPGGVSNPILGDMPRYFVNEPQNILAPEFRFGPGCPYPTPQGYQDEEYWYVSPLVQLPFDGSTVSNVQILIDSDSDFILRQVWPYLPDYPTGIDPRGSVVIRMRRGDGYVLSSNFLPINAIRGPVFPELRVKAADSLYFDAKIVDAVGVDTDPIPFGLYLYGVRRQAVSG